MVMMSSWIFSSHIFVNLLLLISFGKTYGTDSDIFCLRSRKNSLEDPNNYLQSWNFNNDTEEGFICSFDGVDCWYPGENRVKNLMLSNMGLKGQFPRGILNCSSLTGLDLSVNSLSGTIPRDISTLLQYVTTLDLSSNQFSGEIPTLLANCTYLNSLKLDQNGLTGQIPLQFSLLFRLKTFTVSNNLLNGPVPNFRSGVSVNYEKNQGLCGGPSLSPCQVKASKSSKSAVIAGAAVGGVTLAALWLGIGIFFLRCCASFKKKGTKGEV